MLIDKIKRLENIAKEVSKEKELTPGVKQLLYIHGNELSDEEMRRIWIEVYHCDKNRLLDAVRDSLRAFCEDKRPK